MANELAATVGELQYIDERMAALAARRVTLDERLASLNMVGDLMGAPELQAVMPAVRVHTAYGGRGFLTDWVRGVLQAAAPGAVDMSSLVLLAEEHFGLELPTPAARDQYRKNTLGRAVRKLLSLGLVERLHDPAKALGPGLWRWKAQVPELGELSSAVAHEAG